MKDKNIPVIEFQIQLQVDPTQTSTSVSPFGAPPVFTYVAWIWSGSLGAYCIAAGLRSGLLKNWKTDLLIAGIGWGLWWVISKTLVGLEAGALFNCSQMIFISNVIISLKICFGYYFLFQFKITSPDYWQMSCRLVSIFFWRGLFRLIE